MADQGSNEGRKDLPIASRAEIDALGEIIAATLAMAVRTRSVAATALLERALETLDDRIRAMGGPKDDAPRRGFKPS